MSNALQAFDFEGRGVRTVTDRHGEPWFVAADLCRILALGNPSQALARLDDDEKKTISRGDFINEGITGCDPRVQQLSLVNEPGFYHLVLSSQKPEAQRFKRWVTREVLPSIRKTGAYVREEAAETDPILAELHTIIARRIRQLERERQGRNDI